MLQMSLTERISTISSIESVMPNCSSIAATRATCCSESHFGTSRREVDMLMSPSCLKTLAKRLLISGRTTPAICSITSPYDPNEVGVGHLGRPHLPMPVFGLVFGRKRREAGRLVELAHQGIL